MSRHDRKCLDTTSYVYTPNDVSLHGTPLLGPYRHPEIEKHRAAVSETYFLFYERVPTNAHGIND